MTVERTLVYTRDTAVAVEAFNGLAEHTAQVQITDPSGVGFSIHSARLGDWVAEEVSVVGVRYRAVVEPMPFLMAGVWTAGGGRQEIAGREHAVVRNACFLHPLDKALRCDYVDPGILVLRLPPAYVADLAEEVSGLPAEDLRFLSVEPVTEAMRAHWAATVRFVVDQANDPEVAIPPLVADNLLRLATGALLKTFPNTVMTAAYLPTVGRATPAVARRAAAYMEANAERPLTIAEIAEAVGVGPRILQDAFRRHLDTTPLAHLRRLRLQRVRADLRAAHPADDATIAAIARAWGFERPDRFAAAYYEAFGESPTTS